MAVYQKTGKREVAVMGYLEHGPQTVYVLAAAMGGSSWTTWRALDRLRDAGLVRVVGQAAPGRKGPGQSLYALAPNAEGAE